MALISIIPDFYPTGDTRLLARAEELKPTLHHTIREPMGAFKLKERYSREKNDIVLHQLPHQRAQINLQIGIAAGVYGIAVSRLGRVHAHLFLPLVGHSVTVGVFRGG